MHPAGPNDHFAYDPDQLREIVKGWRELANDYDHSVQDTYPMTSVSGPGLEYASEGHAALANGSGQAYADSLRASAAYCSAEADKYQKALDTMLGIDSDNETSIKNTGDTDGGI